MALTYILRKFAIFVDGVGKLGEGENARLPIMEVRTEEWRGAGMDTAVRVDVGTAPLNFEFKLSAMDPQVYALWGLACGQAKWFTVNGALDNLHLGMLSDKKGTTTKAAANMQGYLRRVEADPFEPGRKVLHSFVIDLLHYKLDIGEKPIFEIDVLGGHRIVAGHDQVR